MKRSILCLAFIAVFLGGCSKKSESDYMNTANSCIQKMDLKGTIAAYEALLRDYPDGENTPQALYNLGRLYQDKLDKNLPMDGSDRKAIGYYQQVVDKFPKAKVAPAALFNIGFLRANELMDLKGGQAAYEKFLHDYPNDPLVPSAKFEIENLGRTPDEITDQKD